MLDNETKRRIDKARDILVGKIPDPKSQVEQITIALIYKFMDDMDVESVELGGAPSFFTDAYQKYAWRELLKPTMGGNERLNLYGEAIAQMNQNPELPQLFRDIFKNAYLPYRDPETLTMFLKTIDEFNYDHSERLGDAFEYLLSVLGSQGDAGQFRTPRHIIDFMAAVVQPKKTDVIGDPACGTAGFLIAAYKFILAQNKNALNDVERKQLAQNLIGYDISPDMVRLSRVNLFLHRFVTPTIFEYDTLTSQEKWGDYFDVILANPPFMSPRGGITPHKRFSVQSNRSEVLFVDYIAEHLKPEGRAGIIVPEGIIFQSANAYKQLREMLVKNNYLYAVVSLPAGVFNPYSGVKTSILFIDKGIAHKTNDILFIKITSDGFDLGAQRRANNTSDLTAAISVLSDYKTALQQNLPFESTNPIAVIVPKIKIAENGDYNLSADRYKITANAAVSKFEMVRLGDENLFQIDSGGTPSSEIEEYWNGDINWATLVDLPQANFITGIKETQRKITQSGLRNSSAKLIPINSVLVSSRATIGRVAINRIEMATNQGFKNIIIKDKTKVLPEFVAYMMTELVEEMNSLGSGGTFKEISKTSFLTLKIPLPPLEVQRAIVTEIENYQCIIDGAKQVVQNYKPHIHIEREWEMVKLGEVCKVNPKKSEMRPDLGTNTLVSFVPMADLNENQVDFIPKETRILSEVIGSYTYFENEDVLVAKVTPCFENGKAGIAKNLINGIGFGSSEYYVLRSSENVLPMWIYLQIKSDNFLAGGKLQMSGTSGLQRVQKDFVSNFPIPLPSLESQKEIVAAIECEQMLVNANKELIVLMEAKIAGVIARVWK